MNNVKLLFTLLSFGFITTTHAQFWDHSEPEKLGGDVNSEAEESIPVFSKDSSFLYFVRTFDAANKGGENDQDIWRSQLDESGNYVSSELVKDVNNKYNNAVLGLNKTGTTMYLLNSYDGKKDFDKGIAVSTYNNGNWSSPEKIEIPGLSIEGDFYGFHVNEEENVIIISHKGPNSLGEEDFYVSTKSGEEWSTPVHMGNSINSAGFEIAPFLSPSQDTLYFSSNGFGGYGDADIFYAVKQGSWTDWSAPINLGDRINSPKFDAYFIYSGNQAFWSSNRDGELSDIYRIDIYTPPPLVVKISCTDITAYDEGDGTTKLEVQGGVSPYSYSWSNGEKDKDLRALSKGDYSVIVTDQAGQKATAECVIDEPEEIIVDLAPVIASDYTNLDFMQTFSYNKNKLNVSRGDFKLFIKEVEAQLKNGRPSITIKVRSSASNVPTKKFASNQELATMRAENIKYDIIGHFEKKKEFKGKVNVVVESSVVAGPTYEDDAKNKEKYEPFQFVQLSTE